VDIIKLLLDKGMSVNLPNTYVSTPLHVSSQFVNLEVTKTLVDRGFAINKLNKYGYTALALATRERQLEFCRYLTKIGAVMTITDAKTKLIFTISASDIVEIFNSIQIRKFPLN
jgi:ankyrin repeat protein